MSGWIPPEAVSLESIRRARIELRWALRILVHFDRSIRPSFAVGEDCGLLWNTACGRLESSAGGPKAGRVAALRVSPLTLLVLSEDGSIMEALPLDGLKLSEAYKWLTRLLSVDFRYEGVGVEFLAGSRSLHKLRPHRFARSQPGSQAVLEEWIERTHDVLFTVRKSILNAGPVYFPSTSLHARVRVVLPNFGDHVERSVVLGVALWDDFRSVPYFYVRAESPSNNGLQLPPLSVGQWSASGWFGAILTYRELVEADIGTDHPKMIRHFLRTAAEQVSVLLIPL